MQSYEPQRFYLQKFTSFLSSYSLIYYSSPAFLSFSTFSQISRILSLVTKRLTADYIIIKIMYLLLSHFRQKLVHRLHLLHKHAW